MSKATFLNRHEMNKKKKNKRSVLHIQLRTLFLFLLFAFFAGRYSKHKNFEESSIKVVEQQQVEEKCTVWLRYKIKTDMIKVTVPCQNTLWADIKSDAQRQLGLGTVSAPDIWLIHPTLGRLKANNHVQNMTRMEKPILVYIDSFDSRIELKKRISIPINLSETLCLIEYENGKYDSTAYKALYDVLYDNNFTAKQTQDLRKRLCGSSTQGGHTFYAS